MKKIILFCFCLSTLTSIAQQQTYDLITFTPPKGWKKKSDIANAISYSTTDNVKRTWAQIGIIKSTTSKGSIDADFENEWKELVVKPYKQYGITEQPLAIDTQTFNGWKLRTGLGKFVFNKDTSIVLLNTFSDGQRCASLTMMSNTKAYGEILDKFLASVNLPNPGTAQHQNNVNNSITSATITNTNFKFNTSNFDDGWTSTVQEDWVEVTKGSMKVLLHYPKEGTIFPADPDVLTTTAWNILVAPRYSNLKNYKTTYITTYDRPYLGMGYATEKATGKNVFIVFFRQGQSGWLEFVAPDKNSFIQQFKFDPETIKWDSNSDLMIPLINMTGYNKFAVAASDLKGKWTSDFTGIQQLYNVYTGQYAGMNINQSNEEFVFGAGNSYNWKLLAVNGMVGNAKYTEVKSSGQFNVPNNWQIYFSRIETGPRTFHAFWSCIKGARVLNLLDANASGSGIYTKYGLAK
jgi:hypothetical protein